MVKYISQNLKDSFIVGDHLVERIENSKSSKKEVIRRYYQRQPRMSNKLKAWA